MQKILVIDDDRDMCLLLKRFLSKHGFEVIEANTAKRAYELLETPEFDSGRNLLLLGWSLRNNTQIVFARSPNKCRPSSCLI